MMRGFLLGLTICCSACGTDGGAVAGNPAPGVLVSKPVVYTSGTPGNGLPEITYSAKVEISGYLMTTVRAGGTSVNTGTCTKPLTPSEIDKINGYIVAISAPNVVDATSNATATDASLTTLQVGDKALYSGPVYDAAHQTTPWHTMPQEASDLGAYLDTLVVTKCGNTYR